MGCHAADDGGTGAPGRAARHEQRDTSIYHAGPEKTMLLGGKTAVGKRETSPWLFPFTHWNWKVALLTALLRGGVCVAALRHVEVHARRHFGIVEAAFVLLTCGFLSALQQQSLSLRTERLAWLACVVVVPLVSLGMDAGLHFWLDGRRTQQLGIPALAFTLFSATFHWHMIRNGALLIGEEAHSLGTDLRRIPRLIVSYFTAPAAWVGGILAVRGSAGTTAMEAASSGGSSL
ncbi:MAG: hypothetical protein WA374_16510 [Acidobacteriaceae bacterium]